MVARAQLKRSRYRQGASSLNSLAGALVSQAGPKSTENRFAFCCSGLRAAPYFDRIAAVIGTTIQRGPGNIYGPELL